MGFDPRAIHQIEFVGKLKNRNNQIADNQAMFALIISEKIKETRLTFSQGSVTVL